MRVLFTDRRYSDDTTVIVECKKMQLTRHGQNDVTIKFWDLDNTLYLASHAPVSKSDESIIQGSLIDNSYINLSMYEIETGQR